MEASEILRTIMDPNPALSHRFGVFFMSSSAIPNPLDFRFQKVSGLSTEVQLDTVNEGGQNLYTHRLPGKIGYNNLVLERGYSSSPIPSSITVQFNYTFSTFKFNPFKVLVMLFSESGIPLGTWMFENAYPVKWSVSDLDAQNSSVLIDSMEIAYTRFQAIRL